VQEHLASDRHAELRGRREVRLRGFARSMRLGEPDLSVGTMLGPPPMDPTLQRAQMRLVVPPRLLRLQEVQHRLRLQPRHLRQHGRDRRPVLGERIRPRPPPPRCFISDGSLPAATYRRAVFRSMSAFMAACPMCPSLLISSMIRLTCASLTGLKKSPARFAGRRHQTTHRRCGGWGDVIVADGEM
jgi:hypothetical protein